MALGLYTATMTNFSLDAIRLEQNDWVQTEVEYSGNGSVDFTNPVGSVVGPFVLRFNDRGLQFIETEFDTISCDPDYDGPPIAFLFGSKIDDNEKAKSWAVGGTQNPCHNLRVDVPKGTITSEGPLQLSGLETRAGKQTLLRFHASHCRFDVKDSKPAKYFAIPLINFVSSFPQQILGHHPLRINPTPEIPPDVPESCKALAHLKANGRNQVVGFHFEKTVAYIEPLSDYEQRVKDLTHGLQRCVTSVLVGEIGVHETKSIEDIMKWFPTELFAFLSFATGHELGAPWIELRDEENNLVSRFHTNLGFPIFDSGDSIFSTFDRDASSGLGPLSDLFLLLSPEEKSLLSIVMMHTRLGSLALLKIHDTLDHLIRGIESLCKYHNLSSVILTNGLDASTDAALRNILSEARGALLGIMKKVKASGADQAARQIERVIGRVSSAASKENDFGLSVVELLQKFGLPDYSVIDRFYSTHPRKDERNWASVLSYYRGATIHEGAFDFEKRHDINDVVTLCRHLRDILIRITLATCRYQGTYQPAMSSFSRPTKINWVTPTTDAKQLGYE